MQYLAWRALVLVASHMPLRLSYTIAWLAGSIAWYAWPRGRRATVANYRRVLRGAPRSTIRASARRSIAAYLCYVVELARLEVLGARGALKLVENPEVYERLRAETATGRGIIIAGIHQGNWDTGAAGCAASGLAPAVVIETFADPRFDAAMSGLRASLGMTPVRMERLGPSLVRHLRGGGVVAILMDRPVASGVEVTFFGEQTHVPGGLARLALMTGARVVPATFVHTAPRRPSVRALADFDIETPSRATPDAEQELTQAVMRAHERFIRQYPEQWYMFRRFWPASAATSRGGRSRSR